MPNYISLKKMDQKKLEKIEDALSEINKSVASIDKTLAVNTASLEEHVRRTHLLEEKLEKAEDKFELKLEPLESHVQAVRGLFKYGSIVLGSLGAILGILHQLGIL
jgi:chromosome segregation ATPase